MKDSGFKQSSLFPEHGSTIFELQVGVHPESERIGVWIRVWKPPLKQPLYERTGWKNCSTNGMANVIRELVDAIYETEEHHGIQMDGVELAGKSAPF